MLRPDEAVRRRIAAARETAARETAAREITAQRTAAHQPAAQHPGAHEPADQRPAAQLGDVPVTGMPGPAGGIPAGTPPREPTSPTPPPTALPRRNPQPPPRPDDDFDFFAAAARPQSRAPQREDADLPPPAPVRLGQVGAHPGSAEPRVVDAAHGQAAAGHPAAPPVHPTVADAGYQPPATPGTAGFNPAGYHGGQPDGLSAQRSDFPTGQPGFFTRRTDDPPTGRPESPAGPPGPAYSPAGSTYGQPRSTNGQAGTVYGEAGAHPEQPGHPASQIGSATGQTGSATGQIDSATGQIDSAARQAGGAERHDTPPARAASDAAFPAAHPGYTPAEPIQGQPGVPMPVVIPGYTDISGGARAARATTGLPGGTDPTGQPPHQPEPQHPEAAASAAQPTKPAHPRDLPAVAAPPSHPRAFAQVPPPVPPPTDALVGAASAPPPPDPRETAVISAPDAPTGLLPSLPRTDNADDPPNPDPDPGSRIRTAVRTAGELMITFGLIVLLFAGYEVFGNAAKVQDEQDALASELDDVWNDPTVGPSAPGVAKGPNAPGADLVGRLYIPKLHKKWVVVDGVQPKDIRYAPGHYPETAKPGEVGNFSVAGHRIKKIFWRLDELVDGDVIGVETRENWYVYRVYDQEIVKPTAVAVVAPVPNKPRATPIEALLTLTTCNPKFNNYQRLIVHAKLESATPRDQSLPEAGMPAEIKAK